MNQLKRRSTYQFGSLVQEQRKKGSVWVYRYTEFVKGKKKRPKVFVGTVEQYPTHEDAERAAEHLRLAANAEASAPSTPTMRGVIDRYIREVLRPCLDVPLGGTQEETARMSYHNAKSYQSVLFRWVLPRWEEYPVSDFERPEVGAALESWFRSLWRSASNPHGLAPKSVRGICNVMRQVFKFAVKWGYITRNPTSEKRIELPRGSTKRLKKSAQLTPPQFFLLVSMMGSMEQAAVAFAGWLGPRISEAFGLRWGDLDLDLGVVTFRRGFVQGRITPLKTEASRADLPIPEDVLVLLRRWRSSSGYNGKNDWVFASPYTHGSRPFWPGQLLKSHILPVALKAGLPKIGWHSFRHTVSAWAKEAGFTLEEAKTMLRHEDIATTSNVYGDMGMDAKRGIQQRLVTAVKQKAEEQEQQEQQKQERKAHAAQELAAQVPVSAAVQ